MNIQTYHFFSLSSYKFGRHAILTTKIVRRTLTPERAMSGALFAGGCQVWPQPPSAPSSHQSAGWQPKQLGPPLAQVLGGGPPARLERKIRLPVQSAWPAAGALCRAFFSRFFPAFEVQICDSWG